ncbi:hypothetical protein [Mesorhizobium jarvisii]|uniref:hypothetical protein n=1 Tax=Mesorhizobium jarvisii TaxID=1777867 RepID=UPI001317E655|nr:hypothetical protein [Mesorhizobium jarvisii]MCH4557819.1 hypothetical protein [Mesorhizobium jarvisii]QGU20865.1 hypothetical protein MCHK_10290 [Mesorhizobium huakuii 7653R]
MSDEPIKLAEGMTAARQSGRIENHVCEFDVCGKRAPFGFAKPRQPSHWLCFEHREHGDSYLAGVR